jgi:hypothetical protein
MVLNSPSNPPLPADRSPAIPVKKYFCCNNVALRAINSIKSDLPEEDTTLDGIASPPESLDRITDEGMNLNVLLLYFFEWAKLYYNSTPPLISNREMNIDKVTWFIQVQCLKVRSKRFFFPQLGGCPITNLPYSFLEAAPEDLEFPNKHISKRLMIEYICPYDEDKPQSQLGEKCPEFFAPSGEKKGRSYGIGVWARQSPEEKASEDKIKEEKAKEEKLEKQKRIEEKLKERERKDKELGEKIKKCLEEKKAKEADREKAKYDKAKEEKLKDEELDEEEVVEGKAMEEMLQELKLEKENSKDDPKEDKPKDDNSKEENKNPNTEVECVVPSSSSSQIPNSTPNDANNEGSSNDDLDEETKREMDLKALKEMLMGIEVQKATKAAGGKAKD